MKRLGLFLSVLLLPMILAAPAAGDFQPGDGFQIDGVYFYVVSVSPDTGALFRAAARLHDGETGDHADCYRVGRTFYHHEACPALQAHFARAGSLDEAAPPAPSGGVSYASGSHPIDYLRGTYIKRDPPYAWTYASLYYSPWSLGYGGLGFHHRPGRGPGFRGPYRPGHGFRPHHRPAHYGRGFGFHARGW